MAEAEDRIAIRDGVERYLAAIAYRNAVFRFSHLSCHS